MARQSMIAAAAGDPADALLIEWFEAAPAAVDASALPNAVARRHLVDHACELLAARWGVWHPSQFARDDDDKRQFGELPSCTLHPPTR